MLSTSDPYCSTPIESEFASETAAGCRAASAQRRAALTSGHSVSDVCIASTLLSVRAFADEPEDDLVEVLGVPLQHLVDDLGVGARAHELARDGEQPEPSRMPARGRRAASGRAAAARPLRRPGASPPPARSTSKVRGSAASRQSTSRSSSVSRSHVHSNAVSRVRCRPSGTARSRVAKSRSRREASSASERCRATAAASSIASGSPSRRAQTSAASSTSLGDAREAERRIGAAADRPESPAGRGTSSPPERRRRPGRRPAARAGTRPRRDRRSACARWSALAAPARWRAPGRSPRPPRRRPGRRCRARAGTGAWRARATPTTRRRCRDPLRGRAPGRCGRRRRRARRARVRRRPARARRRSRTRARAGSCRLRPGRPRSPRGARRAARRARRGRRRGRRTRCAGGARMPPARVARRPPPSARPGSSAPSLRLQARDVALDGAHGDEQLRGDLGVAQSPLDGGEDGALARGQCVCAGRHGAQSRTARLAPHRLRDRWPVGMPRRITA